MDVELLRTYNELFQTQGWKNLLQEGEDELALIKDQLLHDCANFEQVCFLRGQSSQIMKLLTLEDALIAQLQADQANEENEHDANL